MQLPGEESWLDELDEYETESVDSNNNEVRRLVDTVFEDWEEDSYDGYDQTILDLEATPRAAKALGGQKGVAEDTIAGADHTLSSIWDESDAFWSSSTPPYTASQLAAHARPASSTPKFANKRQFEVAKDSPERTQESPVLGNVNSSKKQQDSYKVKSDRARSVLGDGTPNLGSRVQVTTPMVTPGSCYDEDGFLRA
jgi:hypothetical protein